MKGALRFAADRKQMYNIHEPGKRVLLLGSSKSLPHGGTGSAGTLHLEAFKAGAEMDAGWVLLGIVPRFWRPVIF